MLVSTRRDKIRSYMKMRKAELAECLVDRDAAILGMERQMEWVENPRNPRNRKQRRWSV